MCVLLALVGENVEKGKKKDLKHLAFFLILICFFSISVRVSLLFANWLMGVMKFQASLKNLIDFELFLVQNKGTNCANPGSFVQSWWSNFETLRHKLSSGHF